jgi:S-adenosylmethionine-diacylglycerol 3-amino-3-carboxypropyl transferase
VALKLAGAEALEYEDYLVLLGLRPGDARAAYRRTSEALDDDARAFWDEHQALLDEGALRCGKFERYLAMFRQRVLPLVHSRAVIDGLLALDRPEAQRRYFDARWNSRRWRALFRVFFSRRVMARLGRSPEHFAQVHGSVAERLLARTEHVLTELPVRQNPFLQWILTGGYPDLEVAHPYLTRAGFARLKERADRVALVHASLEEHLPAAGAGAYSAFNLSNIGEYLPVEVFDDLYGHLLRAARPGARIAYWNLFVPRQRPEALADRVRRHPERAGALLARDRAFFYGAFHLETVAG